MFNLFFFPQVLVCIISTSYFPLLPIQATILWSCSPSYIHVTTGFMDRFKQFSHKLTISWLPVQGTILWSCSPLYLTIMYHFKQFPLQLHMYLPWPPVRPLSAPWSCWASSGSVRWPFLSSGGQRHRSLRPRPHRYRPEHHLHCSRSLYYSLPPKGQLTHNVA